MRATYDGQVQLPNDGDSRVDRWMLDDEGKLSYVYLASAGQSVSSLAAKLRTIADKLSPATSPEVSIADSVREEFRQDLDEANKRLDEANERLGAAEAKNKDLAKAVKQMASRKRSIRLAVDSNPSGWTVTANLLARANDIKAYITTGVVRNR